MCEINTVNILITIPIWHETSWRVAKTHYYEDQTIHINVQPSKINKVPCLTYLTKRPLWASYQIRKSVGCACAGNAGNVFPHRQLRRILLVRDPGMRHGTCVTHVPWCMSGLLTRGGREKWSRHSRRMRTSNFMYLARGLCNSWLIVMRTAPICVISYCIPSLC